MITAFQGDGPTVGLFHERGYVLTLLRYGARIYNSRCLKMAIFVSVALFCQVNADYSRTTTSGVFTYYLGSGQSFDNLTKCYIKKITCSRASDLNNYTFPTAVTWASGGSASAKVPKVYKINSGVLAGNSNLKTVTIPWSITTIGQPCFKGCVNLSSIYISGGNSTTEYNSKDGVLYDSKFTILKKYPEGKAGTSYTVPGTVTELGTCCLVNTKISSLYFSGDAPACPCRPQDSPSAVL